MLLSLKSFRLGWPAALKTFSVLLVSIFFVETIALLWKYCLHDKLPWGKYSNSNIWLYNAFLVPQYLLFMRVYYRVLQAQRIKRAIIISAVVYSVLGLCNMLFFQSVHSINSFTIVLANIIAILLTICYFEQLWKQKELVRLSAEPMVWISLGVFVFHTANVPYMLCLDYLIHTNIPLAIALFYIYLALNCIMYTLFTIAFLCHRPKEK